MFKKYAAPVLLSILLSVAGCSGGEDPASSQEAGQSAIQVQWDNPPMPEGAEGTFVVVADVVFVREDPQKILPHENAAISELDSLYTRNQESFPRHFFYGENIAGERVKESPDVVAINADKEGRTAGYIDVKKLWHEPALSNAATLRHMSIRDTDARIVPDKKSRVVISLYQGEVIECVGQLEQNGILWMKAKFYNARYGYIEAKDIEPLYQDKVDQSSIALSEIPESMRYSDLSFSDRKRERLAKDGFYIETLAPDTEIYVDDMVDLYEDTGSSVFITADLFLHSFHLIFDRCLQDIEEKKLFPAVKSLTLNLVEETEKEMKSSEKQDVNIQKALLHNLFFFSVAAKLFDPKFTPSKEVGSDVDAIVEKIVAAEGSLPSLKNKIDLGGEDFTQYRVRGHYEKKTYSNEDGETMTNDILERYFRGMMWYGRRSFPVSNEEKTLSAILMARSMGKSDGFKEWKRIDDVLTRLMGKTDDWTPKDYGKVNKIIFGKETPEIEDIVKGGDRAIGEFMRKAPEVLSGQKIVSAQTGINHTQAERLQMTSGLKFLGQRFTWDAYIFNQLSSPSVGSDENPRNLPTSLDVMTVFGSKAADGLMAAAQAEMKWNNYDSQMEKIKKEIAGEIEKKSTFYDAWMNTLKALFASADSKQLFAIKEPWQFKNLNSALGSWTEAKHDTILYAEQSYAEGGGGDGFEIPGYIPPYEKGYVEPNPVFFSALLNTVSRLRLEMGSDFLTDEYDDKLQTFESLVKRAGGIAKKEVDGSPITEDDYLWISDMKRSFDRHLLLPRDIGDVIDPDYLKMALIADVSTDAVSGRVLEVAVGFPKMIVVAVKDAFGGTRITIGYVYSWYEFSGEKRLTDTEWKDMVYRNDARLNELKPAWYSKIIE